MYVERPAVPADQQLGIRIGLCQVASGAAGRSHALLHAGPGPGHHGSRARVRRLRSLVLFPAGADGAQSLLRSRRVRPASSMKHLRTRSMPKPSRLRGRALHSSKERSSTGSNEAGVKWRIYGCDSFPNVALLKGVSRTFDIDEFDEDFARGRRLAFLRRGIHLHRAQLRRVFRVRGRQLAAPSRQRQGGGDPHQEDV